MKKRWTHYVWNLTTEKTDFLDFKIQKLTQSKEAYLSLRETLDRAILFLYYGLDLYPTNLGGVPKQNPLIKSAKAAEP